MAYIAPNTDIIILQDVPLESDYENTIYFNSSIQQENYFKAKALYTFTEQTYQRISLNRIRINQNAESLYRCNYLMIKNKQYLHQKWFYCFIDEIIYINNEVSEVVYTVDVMQTWHYNYTLQECFVEREHASTDTLFSNIVPENLELGSSYVANSMPEDATTTPHPIGGCMRFEMNDMEMCIITSQNYTAPTTVGPLIANNIYYPTKFIFIPFDYTDLTATAQAIYNALQNIPANDIVNIVQIPNKFHTLNAYGSIINFKIHGNFTHEGYTPNLDGYTPKNKKLFSYPYNFLFVTNNCGQTATLKWEDWTIIGNNYTIADFEMMCCLVPSPTVKCVPILFRGTEKSFDDALSYSDFPTNMWDVDSFRAWWQCNKNSFAVSQISSVISALTGVAANPTVGGVISSTANVALRTASSLAKIQDLKATPHQVHGQTQNDTFNPAFGRMSFDFYRMSIKRKQAKIIDDYFDKYGYATHEVKVPNRNVRDYWTYTQTVGCQIDGSVPNSDRVKICKIYDKGITFWRCNGTATEPVVNVGDYTQDNEIDKLVVT